MIKSSIKRKALNIYLVDPVHNYISSRDIWTIPLNILTIASYTKEKFNEQVKIDIFKFPNDFFKALNETKPDIVATSNYIWNFELSKYILFYSKKIDRKIITVMGGPNVTPDSEWMTSFFLNSSCDIYIPGSGEYPFRCLVEKLLDCDFEYDKNIRLQGCWQFDNNKKQAIYTAPQYTIKNLDEIPSPFTNKMVDVFFQKSLMPMIETVRGCPFKCTYCNWGDATLGNIYKYSTKRVKNDIDYCRRFSTNDRLMIDDANFGLLPSRDLEIAKFIQGLKRDYNWPGKIILTWGQAKSDVALQIADTLKELCMMTQSSQSLNERVLKNIKRKNISKNNWKKVVDFCNKNSIETYAELMIPLPEETLSSYLEALKFFFDLEVDFLNTNPLMLLNGSEMNTVENRKKYSMQTKWRLLENCYGIYDDYTAIEYQEMVISTNTFSYENYIFCRILSWLIQMSWNLKRHYLILRLMLILGINPVDFLRKIIQDSYGTVKQVLNQFTKDAQDELFNSKNDLINHYSNPNQMRILKNGGFRKLNTYYSSLVALKYDKEFNNYYEKIANKLVTESQIEIDSKSLIHECRNYGHERFLTNEDLFNLEHGKNINKKLKYTYDFLSLENKNNSEIVKEEKLYNFFIEEEQKEALLSHLKYFSGINREYQLRKLQEPYHGIHKKHLLFRIKEID